MFWPLPWVGDKVMGVHGGTENAEGQTKGNCIDICSSLFYSVSAVPPLTPITLLRTRFRRVYVPKRLETADQFTTFHQAVM